MAPQLSLAGKAVREDMDEAQVLNDSFALHLFLFIFAFRGIVWVFWWGRGSLPGKVCL